MSAAEIVCTVHVLAGDSNGGPHTEAALGLDRDAETLTDEEIAEWREAVSTMYERAFSEPPESVIVWIEDAA